MDDDFVKDGSAAGDYIKGGPLSLSSNYAGIFAVE
jgi:hypothetical protein